MDVACGSLSDHQLQFFIQEFEKFQRRQPVNGQDALASVMRQVGLCPTEAELAEMLEDVPNPAKIELPDFILLVHYFLRGADTTEDLIRAFAVFDANHSGKIATETAGAILSGLKHPVPEQQIDDLLQSLDNGGFVVIEDMVQRLKPI
jgi:Ca2+-binding EF-hand superfamily protein